jgi:hypothetical protein
MTIGITIIYPGTMVKYYSMTVNYRSILTLELIIILTAVIYHEKLSQ